jgi:putative FmdB family regulatory protein
VPTYEFRCRTCDSVFEERRPMAQVAEPAACPDGHADTVRLLSFLAATRPDRANGGAAMAAPGAGGGCGGGGGCGCR